MCMIVFVFCVGSHRLLYHIAQSKTQTCNKNFGFFYGYRVGKHIELI